MFLSLLPAVEKQGKDGHLAGYGLDASNGQDQFCWIMAWITRNLMEPVCVRTPTAVGFKLNFEDREKNATRYTDK